MKNKNKSLAKKVEVKSKDFLGLIWSNWIPIAMGFMMCFIWFCVCWTVSWILIS